MRSAIKEQREATIAAMSLEADRDACLQAPDLTAMLADPPKSGAEYMRAYRADRKAKPKALVGEILLLLDAHGPKVLTVHQVAASTGAPLANVERTLALLERDGIIRRTEAWTL